MRCWYINVIWPVLINTTLQTQMCDVGPPTPGVGRVVTPDKLRLQQTKYKRTKMKNVLKLKKK